MLNVAGPLSRENGATLAISVAETVDVIQEVELLVSLVDMVAFCKHEQTYEIRHTTVGKKYGQYSKLANLMLDVFASMSASSYASFLTFGKDMQKDELPAYGNISNFGEWTWPPKDGISLSCWVRIKCDRHHDLQNMKSNEICIIDVQDAQRNTVFGVYLGKEDITFVNGSGESAYFRHNSSIFTD